MKHLTKFFKKKELSYEPFGDEEGKRPPMFTMEMVFTFTFLTVSLIMVCGGYYHCTAYYETTYLSCVHDHCNLELTRNGGGEFIQYDFEKSALVSAYVCRMKKGEVINVAGMTTKKKRGLTYSYCLKAHLPDENGDASAVMELPLTVYDTGKRKARTTSEDISDYIKNKSHDSELLIEDSKSVSALGIILIIFGILMGGLTVLLGEFSNPDLKRKKSR